MLLICYYFVLKFLYSQKEMLPDTRLLRRYIGDIE